MTESMKSARTWMAVTATVLSIAGFAACGPDATDTAAGSVPLPGGEAFEIPVLGFERPVTRQAAGIDKQWQEAGAAYQAGDYATSERLFGEIERDETRDPERHDAALYRGISLLLDGRHGEARQVLERSSEIAEETGVGGSADHFYLGVAALGEQDVAAATAELEQAVGGSFDQQAQALLSQLRASR